MGNFKMKIIYMGVVLSIFSSPVMALKNPFSCPNETIKCGNGTLETVNYKWNYQRSRCEPMQDNAGHSLDVAIANCGNEGWDPSSLKDGIGVEWGIKEAFKLGVMIVDTRDMYKGMSTPRETSESPSEKPMTHNEKIVSHDEKLESHAQLTEQN